VSVRAVIFDYYGTLTVSASASQRRAGSARVAAALGVAPELFFEASLSTFTERATGRCGDMSATMAWLARRCGREPTAAQLAAACAERLEVERGYIRMLRQDAVPTLRWLREQGLRLGVVSDCTHELADCWTDAAVFSVVIGRRKPHPSLYLTACDRLGVAPSEAVYVGDGGSEELTGARAVGMSAIRLVADDASAALVYDAEQDWTGPVIHSLAALTSGVLPVATRLDDESERA
jgi:putative hydrolase of the HAD superfamily